MAGGDEVLGLFVGTVTDLGHRGLSLKSSSDLDVSSDALKRMSTIVNKGLGDAGWLVPSYSSKSSCFCRVRQNFHFLHL